ncbi:hypothetical protein NP493_416g02016 [Ridgeia piscesae]|uniref:Uncharacterized protein n=1 Tax=Ridgeia piscesae TaxID=27915 RepID=A0AAD9L249_RIDPI|nr:hypothetical protein NP493_416g02016 [Ridgeia piscesae]
MTSGVVSAAGGGHASTHRRGIPGSPPRSSWITAAAFVDHSRSLRGSQPRPSWITAAAFVDHSRGLRGSQPWPSWITAAAFVDHSHGLPQDVVANTFDVMT